MYPRGHGLNFVRQAMYFILMMFVMATAFYIWDVVAMVRLGVGPKTIVLKVREPWHPAISLKAALSPVSKPVFAVLV